MDVGAGGDHRSAERGADGAGERMRGDSHGKGLPAPRNPVRHPLRGRQHPGHRSGPGVSHLLHEGGRQSGEERKDLLEGARNQYESRAHRPALEPEKAPDRRGPEGVAAETEHSFARVDDDAAPTEHAGGAADVPGIHARRAHVMPQHPDTDSRKPACSSSTPVPLPARGSGDPRSSTTTSRRPKGRPGTATAHLPGTLRSRARAATRRSCPGPLGPVPLGPPRCGPRAKGPRARGSAPRDTPRS